MSTLTCSSNLVTVDCCHAGCHVTFAMPETWHAHFKNTHNYFYCPAGHPQHFVAETGEEMLRKKLAQLQTNIEHKEAAINSYRLENNRLVHQRRGLKGALKRIRTRVHAGVCPDCNRTFLNLARHMACKHPAE